VNEVGIALKGLKTLVWVFGGLLTGIGGYLAVNSFEMTGKLGNIEGRLTSIEKSAEKIGGLETSLTRIEATLKAQQHTENIPPQGGKTVTPEPSAFPGWLGVKIPDPEKSAKEFQALPPKSEGYWVFTKDPSAAKSLEPTPK